MSQENVELVRESYESPDALAAFADRIAPDVEFDFTSVYPDRPVVKGAEAARRFRSEGPWSWVSFEPERFFDVDDERVLVFVRVTATGQESGILVEIKAAHEFTIRGGLLVRFKAYADRAEALEAAGLST